MAAVWRAMPDCILPSDGQLQKLSQGALPLLVEDALFHLRVDTGIEDELVESLIRSIQSELEPPSGWLGRTLTTSTYRLVLPRFAKRIRLAGAPIQSVDSITYRDSSGDVRTVDPDSYRLTDDAVPSVVPVAGRSWPSNASLEHDAVSINYTAGFGTDQDVPEDIKQYIRLMVGYRYDVRKSVVVGTIAAPSPYVRNMLENWRVHL